MQGDFLFDLSLFNQMLLELVSTLQGYLYLVFSFLKFQLSLTFLLNRSSLGTFIFSRCYFHVLYGSLDGTIFKSGDPRNLLFELDLGYFLLMFCPNKCLFNNSSSRRNGLYDVFPVGREFLL